MISITSKISPIFGKAEESFDELKKVLIEFKKDKEDGNRLRDELDDHWKEIKRVYHSFVNPSIYDRDDNRIIARYLEQIKIGKQSTIEPLCPYRWVEVFKNRLPQKMIKWDGYYVLLEGQPEKGSHVCNMMGIKYGQDSAPRYLWRKLNILANKNGVEHQGFYTGNH